MQFYLHQVTNFATEFIRYKEDGKRPVSSGITEKTTQDTKQVGKAPIAGNSTAFSSNTKKKKPNK